MKKLLNKTLKTFTLYSLFVLAGSVVAYYYLTDSIWLEELDEHNKIIADRTEDKLNTLNLSDSELSKSIQLWNKIQPGTNLIELDKNEIKADSLYTILRRNPYVTEREEIDRFRCLSRIILIHEKPYQLIVEANVEESEETVIAIAGITFLFFLLLVIGFLLLNNYLSAKIWKPFRNTLSKLKTFNLNSQSRIAFEKSDTLEFEELNDALSTLIEQNISVYKMQKEFTENASHELQTPLAIIKNKLDLLLQKETLSDRQYQIIEEINIALTRISRINKNLLLLTKIENHQFDNSETVNMSLLISQCLQELKEHSDHKSINIKIEIENDITIEGNRTLIEILTNNLLINAIRYSQKKGEIIISLNRKEFIVSNSGNEALNSENIFMRFAKVSDENSGHGLGLAIIKEICKRHEWTARYRFENNLHHFSIRF